MAKPALDMSAGAFAGQGAQLVGAVPQPHEFDQPSEALAEAARRVAHQIPDVEKPLSDLIARAAATRQFGFFDQTLHLQPGELSAHGGGGDAGSLG